jgi:hypothetical protein
MPTTIGNALRAALPPDQRDGLEDYLWAASGAHCDLCEGRMNPASDHLAG